MLPQLEPISATLKAARQRKGLSQRALAAKAGVPQGHISRIENAAVDLQTTSLIAIARALDLELMLVARQAKSAVQALQRETAPTVRDTARYIHGLRARTARLERRFGTSKALRALNGAIDVTANDPFESKAAAETLSAYENADRNLHDLERRLPDGKEIDKEGMQTLKAIADDLKRLHRPPLFQLPAYSLDDEGDDDA